MAASVPTRKGVRGPHRLRMFLAVSGGFTAALMVSFLACGPAASRRPPNLLLITVDTLRPDYMSMNGYDRRTTPRIDELLAGGFYFEQAIAPIARTTQALASLLTGSYPHTTQVRTLTDRLSGGVTTLTEILRERGYRTVAVVTNRVLRRARGLDRGFEVYDMAPNPRTAEQTTTEALSYLDAIAPDQPVFLWVHYIDPHVPYHSAPEYITALDPGYEGRYRLRFGRNRGPGDPRGSHRAFPEELPKPEATLRNPLPDEVNAHIRRLYAADILSLDAQVGRLVDAARSRFEGEWIIVFTADHGESLGEHDYFFDHGEYVYDAGTRVPLGLLLPETHPLHGSGRCPGWVSLVDVVPTLLEILGLDAPESLSGQLEGRSLVDCLRGRPLAERPVFAESGHSEFFEYMKRRKRNDVAGRIRAVVMGDWKLIWTPFENDDVAWELYDLKADPNETHNLYRPDHPKVAPLKEALRSWVFADGDDASRPPRSPEDLEALRALGYVQ